MFHPLYSPNLSQSDFYLFLTLKQKLENIQMVDGDDPFERLQEILMKMAHEELNRVFQTWVQ
jgi:hypothetical protein